MKKYNYAVALLAIVLLAAGCSKTAQDNPNQPQSSERVKQKSAGGSKELANIPNATRGAKLAGTRVELQNINSLKPGDVTLAFRLYGIDAHELGLDDLKMTHEKLVHLMLVRDDLQYYQHLHPEFVQGMWTVKTRIPQHGSYEMYVDVEPKEESPHVLRVPLTIGRKTEKKIFPPVSQDLTTNVDGVNATLDKLELEKKAAEIKLKFKLSKNGLPITQIQSYLGAFGHVVALKHGEPDHFAHAHLLNKTMPEDGIVEFEIELQEKGMYTIYAQFNINGQIKTFPITLETQGSGGAQKMEESKHME